MLDMFGQTQADTDAYVQRNNTPRLPVGFGEAFQAHWNENQLFGQSIAGEKARSEALSDAAEDLYNKTGNPAFHPAVVGRDLDGLNASIRLANQKDNAGLDEITPESIQQRAVEKSRAARTELADVNAREKTLGGTLGGLTGVAASSLADPVNLVVAPLAAPEGLGLLATALAWSAIAGASQAAIEAVGSPYRDLVQPGYSASGEPARNILGATAFGGAAGGTFKGLGMAWTRAKTGVWPRSIRDAGNVVESEANVANSNVLPGLEGEVAHREALAKTIDDVVAGRKVEPPASVTEPRMDDGGVIWRAKDADYPVKMAAEAPQVGPDGRSYQKVFYEGRSTYVPSDELHPTGHGGLFDLHDAKIDGLMGERAGSRAAAEEAKAAGAEPAPELPLEATKQEVHEGTIADGVQSIAKMTGYDMPREEAEKIAKMVAGASDDERARAILSTVFDRPQTVAEFPPSPLPKTAPEPRGTLEPKTVEQMGASTEHEAALRADIDRARAEGDVKIPAGVDEKGDPVFRSVDAAMDEIDGYKAMAEHIKACANPQPEAEAA